MISNICPPTNKLHLVNVTNLVVVPVDIQLQAAVLVMSSCPLNWGDLCQYHADYDNCYL